MKPANILIDDSSNSHFIDFETVCSLSSKNSLKTRVTTLAYVPPEYVRQVIDVVIEDKSDLKRNFQSLDMFARGIWDKIDFTSWNTKALDMWSAGMTAYQILTDAVAPPWIKWAKNVWNSTCYGHLIEEVNVAAAAYEMMLQSKTWTYPDEPSVDPVEALVKRALAFDPAKRITAEEMAKELAKIPAEQS